jgi:hypothetical protein
VPWESQGRVVAQHPQYPNARLGRGCPLGTEPDRLVRAVGKRRPAAIKVCGWVYFRRRRTGVSVKVPAIDLSNA